MIFVLNIFLCFTYFFGPTDSSEQLYDRIKNDTYESRKIPVLVKQLSELIGKQFTQNFHLILIFRGIKLEQELLPKDMTRVYLKTDLPTPLKVAAGLIIVEGEMPLSDILKNIAWTYKTRFIIFEKRYPENNNFYVDNGFMKHQRADITVTHKEIMKHFQNLTTTATWSKERRIWSNVQSTLKEYWAERIQHIAIFLPRKDNVYVYSYFPYTPGNCPPNIRPSLINVWLIAKNDFLKPHGMFPNKYDNLYGCPIHISVVSSPPAIIYKPKKLLEGIEGVLIEEIIDQLNATRKLDIAYDTPSSHSPVLTVLDNVINKNADLGAGMLIPTLPIARDTDAIRYGVSVCLTWNVPNEIFIKPPVVMLFEVFSERAWQLILGTWILSIVLYGCVGKLRKFTWSKEVLDMVAVLFGKPVPHFPREYPLVVFLTSLLWGSFMLQTVFQAGFGSNQLLSTHVHSLRTTKEILASHYEVMGSSAAKFLLDEMIVLNRTNGERVDVKHMDINSAMLKVGYGKRSVYLGLRLSCKYVTRIQHPELRNLVNLFDDCVVRYHPFFALLKSSPLTEKVANTVAAIVENGIVDFWMKKYMSRVPAPRKKGLSHVRDPTKGTASIVIIKYGMFLSFLAFLAEHVIFYITSRKVVINDNYSEQMKPIENDSTVPSGIQGT